MHAGGALEARKYAATLDAYGHQDWRVPSPDELNMLFQNKAAIGGFNSGPAGWYGSSTYYGNASVQSFSDGIQAWSGKGNISALRCVR